MFANVGCRTRITVKDNMEERKIGGRNIESRNYVDNISQCPQMCVCVCEMWPTESCSQERISGNPAESPPYLQKLVSESEGSAHMVSSHVATTAMGYIESCCGGPDLQPDDGLLLIVFCALSQSVSIQVPPELKVKFNFTISK